MQVTKHFIWNGEEYWDILAEGIDDTFRVVSNTHTLVMERVEKPQVSKEQVALPIPKGKEVI